MAMLGNSKRYNYPANTGKGTNMLCLYDSFNKCIISRHRSAVNAAKAKRKFFREFYRNHTSNSYLPIYLMAIEKGELVAPSDSDIDTFYRWEMNKEMNN